MGSSSIQKIKSYDNERNLGREALGRDGEAAGDEGRIANRLEHSHDQARPEKDLPWWQEIQKTANELQVADKRKNNSPE